MAEREGFEPSIEFPLYTLSKRAPSTTRPSLQNDKKLRAVKREASEYHADRMEQGLAGVTAATSRGTAGTTSTHSATATATTTTATNVCSMANKTIINVFK